MDVINRNIIIGVLAILAGVGVILTIVIWVDLDDIFNGVLFIVGGALFFYGINTLIRLVHPQEHYGGNLDYFAYCPHCRQALGGKEKRQAMRTGYCECPKCGKSIKWDLDTLP